MFVTEDVANEALNQFFPDDKKKCKPFRKEFFSKIVGREDVVATDVVTIFFNSESSYCSYLMDSFPRFLLALKLNPDEDTTALDHYNELKREEMRKN